LPLFSKPKRICTGCGREVPEETEFCPYCGTKKQGSAPAGPASNAPPQGQQMRLCPGCGRQIPEGLRFCPYCGREAAGVGPAVQPAPASPAPTAPAPAPQTSNVQPPSSQTGNKVTCGACRNQVPDGLNFCPMCGKPAPYALIVAPQPPSYAAQPPRSTVRCMGCGRDFFSDLNFCPYCGRPNAGMQTSQAPSQPQQRMRMCPGCGRQIPEGLRFCPYCGRPAPTGAPIESEPAPAAQTNAPVPPPAPSASEGMRFCWNCQAEVPANNKFCPECGSPKERK